MLFRPLLARPLLFRTVQKSTVLFRTVLFLTVLFRPSLFLPGAFASCATIEFDEHNKSLYEEESEQTRDGDQSFANDQRVRMCVRGRVSVRDKS